MRTPRSLLVRLTWLLAAVAIAGGSVVLYLARTAPYVQVQTDPKHSKKAGADSPDQAMQWVLLAQRDENGNIPRDGLLKAHAQAETMRRASAQRDAVEEAAGRLPSAAGIVRGGWTWAGPSNIGGRVRAIAIHPGAANVILAGSVGGGIWKSTDSGASWHVTDDFMANLAVTTILFRPGDPGQVYAATGEGFFNQDAIRGAGIFVSSNEGDNWAQLGSTANANFDFVNRIAFSADGVVLMAATRTGLFRSADAGGSWTMVLTQPDMLDVKFIAGSSTLAVAGGRNRNAYFSNNGGVTWNLSTGFPGLAAAERIELAVSRSSPGIVYASLDESSGQIWKSTDSGASFTRISTPAHLSTQGWYDNAIWVDPTNPDHIVTGGVSLFRSTNGGVGFSSVTSCHSDQHAIVSDPGFNGTSNRRVYFGSDGGVCKLEDVTVNTVTSLRNGLGITQFYGAGGNVNAGRIMGGTQDNGTLMYNLGTGTNVWATEFGSDGGFAAVDPTDPNILYGEIQNFRIHRTLTGTSPQYIYGGTGSQSCTKGVPYQITDACDGTANFIAPFILDPNNRDRLLAGGRLLWRTNDARTPNTASTGPSWSSIKGVTSALSNISAIVVASGNSDVIWVGHNNGDLYVTLNGTAGSPAWTRVDNGSPGLPGRTVTSIIVDPIDPRIAYVAFGGFSPDNLWRTTNAGATWVDITGSGGTGLPDAPVRSVAIHPTVPGWLYAATDVGVFASEDGGASWTLPHDGPSNVAVFQLFWMDTLLVAVTHGRGVYTVPAATLFPSFARRPLSQGVISGQTVTFNVFASGAAPISYQWFRGTSGDTSNPIAGATSSNFTTPAITQTATYWVRATNGSGTANSNTATLTPMAWGALIPGTTTQNPTGSETGDPLRAPASAAAPLTVAGTTPSAAASTSVASAAPSGRSALFSMPAGMVGMSTAPATSSAAAGTSASVPTVPQVQVAQPYASGSAPAPSGAPAASTPAPPRITLFGQSSGAPAFVATASSESADGARSLPLSRDASADRLTNGGSMATGATLPLSAPVTTVTGTARASGEAAKGTQTPDSPGLKTRSSMGPLSVARDTPPAVAAAPAVNAVPADTTLPTSPSSSAPATYWVLAGLGALFAAGLVLVAKLLRAQ